MSNQLKRRSAPKKLRAIQTSRHLHVVPHRHTGHVLPSKSTSYPTLSMIVLCVGVLLFSWTRIVTADQSSYTVHVSVPGPPPTIAASIDTPADGTVFTTTPFTVSGTCPLNTYVSLFRNNFASGVALCDATGNYQITSDLFKGINQLVVYDYNFTDAQGPPSNMVTVTYNPSESANSSGNTSNQSSSSSGSSNSKTPYNPSSPGSANLPEPLLLKSNFTFLGYYVGQPANWQIEIEGGTAPYAVEAQWGDGSQQLYSQTKPGTISLLHVYGRTGGYHGSFVVKISATDAAGNQTYLQLLAIISPKPKTVLQGSSQNSVSGSGTSLFGGGIGKILEYTWSGYGVVLLMLISFWLGERRELRSLRLRPKKARHA